MAATISRLFDGAYPLVCAYARYHLTVRHLAPTVDAVEVGRVKRPSDDNTLVLLGELVFPARFTVLALGEGLPYRVELTVAVDADGPRVILATFAQEGDGPEVNGEGVRQVPIGRLLRVAVELAAFRRPRWATVGEDGQMVAVPPMPVSVEEAIEEVGEIMREVSGRPRRWKLTEDHLRAVADTYRANPRDARGRRAPTRAVMDEYGVSHATASRWIAAARKHHLLEPAHQGGKLPPSKKERGRS